MALTLTPGSLLVASAYPDPPFDLIDNGSASGFDIELMRAICAQLGLVLQPVRYLGRDFNGIFVGFRHRTDAGDLCAARPRPAAGALLGRRLQWNLRWSRAA